jgi:hypothetical protein
MQLTDPSPDLISGFAAAALIAIGVFLLLSSRRASGLEELRTFPFAWISIAIGFALFMAVCGTVRGVVYAFLAFALAGYATVASNIAWRTSPARGATSLAAEPDERPTNWRRASAKALLAIVLAGIASFGIGEAFAVAMPMAAPDRIVIGGLLVPVLWGGGMAWTLADSKLRRATIALTIIAAVSFAIAFLPKVFH